MFDPNPLTNGNRRGYFKVLANHYAGKHMAEHSHEDGNRFRELSDHIPKHAAVDNLTPPELAKGIEAGVRIATKPGQTVRFLGSAPSVRTHRFMVVALTTLACLLAGIVP